MKITELLDLIIGCLQKFDPSREDMYQCVTGELSRYIAREIAKPQPPQGVSRAGDGSPPATSSSPVHQFTHGLGANQRQFITETCIGIDTNREVLSACVDALYRANQKLIPSLRSFYLFLFYYTIYLLKVEPFKKLRAILLTQHAPVSLPFLRFVWGDCRPSQVIPVGDVALDGPESSLQTTVRPIVTRARLGEQFQHILEQFFDAGYVATELTSSIMACHADAIEFIALLSHSAEDNFQSAGQGGPAQPRNATQQRPFDLSLPRGRAPRCAEVISTDVKATGIGPCALSATYAEVVDSYALERQGFNPEPTRAAKQTTAWMQRNAERGAGRGAEHAGRAAPSKQGAAATRPPPSGGAARPGPGPGPGLKAAKPRAPPRETRAQVLRADAVIQRRLASEAEEIGAYSAGLRDSSEFDAWRAAALVRDRRVREVEVALRKHAARAACDEARQAQALAAQVRQAQAAEATRVALERLLAHYDRQEARLAEQRQRNADLARAVEEQAAGARAEVAALAQAAGAQRRRERGQNAEALHDERTAELAEKADLVKQIRAMLEVAGAERARALVDRYDPSTVQGFGFLDEMSLSALRQRLLSMKEVNLHLLEDKRAHLQAERARADAELEEKRARFQRVQEALRADRTLLATSGIATGSGLAGAMGATGAAYAKILDEVQLWAQQTLDAFEDRAAAGGARREAQRRAAQATETAARTAVAGLRRQLRARAEPLQTATIFNAHAASGTYTKTTDLALTRAAFSADAEKALAQQSKEADRRCCQAYKEGRLDQAARTRGQQEERLAARRATVQRETQSEDERRRRLVLAEQERARRACRTQALRNPYKAGQGGPGYREVVDNTDEKLGQLV